MVAAEWSLGTHRLTAKHAEKSVLPAPPGTQLQPGRLSGRSRHRRRAAIKERIMLGWAVTFLIIALVAAVLGFGGIATFAVDIAKIIFFVAIVLFVISAVVALVRGRTPTVP
jgi:uncharacterized membrane protein YtjA (UPF0391 family)